MVNVTDSFFELLHDHCLLNDLLHFSHVLVLIANLNNLFGLSGDLLDSLHNDWHLNNFFNDVLYVAVHVNKLRNEFFNLNNLGHFDNLLLEAFYLVNLGYNG